MKQPLVKLPDIKTVKREACIARYSFDESLQSLEENTLTFQSSDHNQGGMNEKLMPLRQIKELRNEANLNLKPINRALVPNIQKKTKVDRNAAALGGSE